MLNNETLLHHRHDDHRDPRQIHGDCCARVQLGGIAPNDCDYCEVPFPCPAAVALAAARAEDDAELEGYARMAAERNAEDVAVTAALRQRAVERALTNKA